MKRNEGMGEWVAAQERVSLLMPAQLMAVQAALAQVTAGQVGLTEAGLALLRTKLGETHTVVLALEGLEEVR